MLTRIYSLYRLYTTLPYLELVTAVSAFVVIVYTYRISWMHPVFLPVCALIILVFRNALTHALFWSITSFLLILGIFQLWYGVDNYQWVIAMWSFVLAVNLHSVAPIQLKESLAKNALIMLALIMLFSAIQKTMGPDYMSGDFFAFTLLTHEEFAILTERCPGISGADLESNRREYVSFLHNINVRHITLRTDSCVTLLATVVTYWTILIEAVIGLLLLIPRQRFILAGHALTILFITVVYAVAPVIGFGSILAVIGIASTHTVYPRLSFIYFLLLFILLSYILPLQHMFSALVNSIRG